MLDWFDLKTVRVEKKGDTQVIHLYLDENEQKPDDGEAPAMIAPGFPIRPDAHPLTIKAESKITVSCFFMSLSI
jgi:hypothetical protein